jgi:hypothetical protein
MTRVVRSTPQCPARNPLKKFQILGNVANKNFGLAKALTTIRFIHSRTHGDILRATAHVADQIADIQHLQHYRVHKVNNRLYRHQISWNLSSPTSTFLWILTLCRSSNLSCLLQSLDIRWSSSSRVSFLTWSLRQMITSALKMNTAKCNENNNWPHCSYTSAVSLASPSWQSQDPILGSKIAEFCGNSCMHINCLKLWLKQIIQHSKFTRASCHKIISTSM